MWEHLYVKRGTLYVKKWLATAEHLNTCKVGISH